MFNSTNIKLGSNSQTVHFNQPSTGILQRSHPKSVFVRFQKSSQMEKEIFPYDGSKPYLTIKSSHDKNYIVVLQILIFGDDSYLVEVVEEEFLNETL